MSVQIRDARVSDIPHLAYVWMQAGGGVFDAIYEGAIPGRETNLIIEHVFSWLNATSSFRNWRILESDGEVVGALHGYRAEAGEQDPEDPLAREDRMHLLTPFVELCPPAGSYYVCAVALYTGSRGRGYGSQLMRAAECAARSMGLTRTSLHVFEENALAVSLYKELGYEELGRSPVVPHSLIRYEGELLLMEKSLL